jgi:hypothetical protein
MLSAVADPAAAPLMSRMLRRLGGISAAFTVR